MTKLNHNATKLGTVLLGAATLTGVTLAAPANAPAAPVLAATQTTTTVYTSWSTLASTADGTLASPHFIGSEITATLGGTNQALATVTLAAGDFSVIDDDTVAGVYTANLTAQGRQKLAAAVTAATGNKNYAVPTGIQGSLAVNPAGSSAAVMTYNYMANGQVIATVHQQVGLKATGTYVAQPPKGYVLAQGQSSQITFSLTTRMLTKAIQVTRQQPSGNADSGASSTASEPVSSAASVAQSIAASKAASEAAQSAAISEANSIVQSKAASEVAENATISEANSIAQSIAASEAAQHQHPTTQPTKPTALPETSTARPAALIAPTQTAPAARAGRKQAVPARKTTRRLTVIVVDADTGEPLQTAMITGVPGDPITFNFHELTQSLVAAGYAVLINPATDLTAFPATNQTLIITVERPDEAPLLTTPLPSEYQSLLPALTAHKTSGAAKAERGAQMVALFQGERLKRQMVYTPFSMTLQQHHGHGGGAPDPAAGAVMLAAYWESLSGVINFGIHS